MLEVPFLLDYRGKTKAKLQPKYVVPTLRAEAHGHTGLIVGPYTSTYKNVEIGEVELNGLTVNDFFCGAGGIGLGFKQAGFDIKGAWDFDKYAVQTYAENIGDHVKQADISKMVGQDVPYADVWTFGFPCQDLSIAGKQAGMIKGKTRSGLFYEVMRLLDEVEQKPKIIMAENVKALKKYLPVLKEEYEAAGYVMYVKLFNSKFWNVPQNRERYIVIGVRKDLDKGFFKWPKQQENFVPKLSSILEDNVDEKFYISDEKAWKVIEQANERVQLKGTHATITPDRVDKRQNGRRAKEEEEPMFTLTSQDHHGIIVLGRAEGINGHDILKRVYDPEGISPTLNTCGGGNTQPKILTVANTNPSGRGMNGNVIHTEGISTTLTTNKGEGHKITDGFRVRKLTPREYARLQGFPDSFKQVVSNSQFYKQMGNAVTVTVSHAVAQAIKEHLQ